MVIKFVKITSILTYGPNFAIFYLNVKCPKSLLGTSVPTFQWVAMQQRLKVDRDN